MLQLIGWIQCGIFLLVWKMTWMNILFLDALASLGSAMTVTPSLSPSVRHTSHLTQPISSDQALLTWYCPSHFSLNIVLPTFPSYSHLTLPPTWTLSLDIPLATIASLLHLILLFSPDLTILTWPSCSHFTLPFPFDLAILTSYCHANLTLAFLSDLDLAVLPWYFIPTWPSHSHLTQPFLPDPALLTWHCYLT